MLGLLPSSKNSFSDAISAFVPAPTNGWDDTQNIASSDPKKALILDNWFPQPQYIELRRDPVSHSDTTEALPVKSLMEYHGPAGTEKLFCAANGKIIDVTGSTASASVTSLSNDKWQHVNFTTSGGHFLYCVNGEDAPEYFDGATWATPTITGADATSFINVSVFKGRLFFIPVSSTKFVYLPLDSIQGAASTFELGGVMSKGGYLVAHATITIDGGSGPDDHAVFITSKGQAIVYQGTDPSDANSFGLVGVYEIPPPIGNRCLTKIAGDVGILTIAGVLPLSKAMVIDKAAVNNIAISQNINTTMTSSARDYSGNFGWQIIVYPRNNMFIVNVPLAESGETHQYVMNTRHGAWCRFKGQNAICWAVFRDELYYGAADGIVYKADSVAPASGTILEGDICTTFNSFGSAAQIKQFEMIRPHILTDGRVSTAIKVHSEWGSHISDAPPSNYIGSTSTLALYWDDGRNWDDGSVWPADRAVERRWRALSAVGRSAAVRMKITASSTVTTPILMQVSGFDMIFKKGGLF